jgi:hypothetical protein
MSNHDLTRFLRQPLKHYSGARLQQGRVLLDSDFNEGALLGEEDRRRAIQDLVGGAATPDDGFSAGRPLPPLPFPVPPPPEPLRLGDHLFVELINLNGHLTFVRPLSVRAGSIYVGGLRFELEQAEHIAMQRDFLQMQPGDLPLHVESPPDFAQLQVLHGWEQTVTPLEDEEFAEAALGASDTSVRVRRMRRVEVFPTSNQSPIAEGEATCQAAWDRFVVGLEGTSGTLDRATGELLSNGRLQLVPRAADASVDCPVCLPATGTRFLGAPNQTIRVLLTQSDRFVWGLDNASALFRVRVTGLGSSDPAAPVQVEMLTAPSDETQWPLIGRVVEITPFGAVLDGEPPPGAAHPHFKKVAERVGAFARVAVPFDPNTRKFTLEPGPGVETMREFIHAWDTRHPNFKELNAGTTPGVDERFFYMRLWHEAADATEIELPATNDPDGPALRGTNLVPLFHALGRRGDFWMASVRPETPDLLVPFDLQARTDGVPPHGPRDFYTPLSVIAGDHDVLTTVSDCRHGITRVTDTDCITLTVGDNLNSRGDFADLQDAIDALPTTGGRIAVRPGVYPGRFTISGRSDVHIEGCGEASIISTPATPPPSSPPGRLFDIVNSQRVSISGLRLHCTDEIGVSIGGSNAEDITLSGLHLLAGGDLNGQFEVQATDGSIPLVDVHLSSVGVSMQGLHLETAARAAIHLRKAQDVRIESATITGRSFGDAIPTQPAVLIEDCNEVTVRDLVMGAFGQVGVAVRGQETTDVELSGLQITCGLHQRTTEAEEISPARSAVDIDGALRVLLEKSWITMTDEDSDHAGVVLGGSHLRIIDNHVEVLPHCFDETPPEQPSQCKLTGALAYGGVHVRGNSDHVDVRANQILGGWGHGITLGSVLWDGDSERKKGAGFSQRDAREDGRTTLTGDLLNPRDDDGSLVEGSDEGTLLDLNIVDNRIEQMGGNGISVLTLRGLPGGDDLVDLNRVRIERNTIVDNARTPPDAPELSEDQLPLPASLGGTGVALPILPIGGIVLATATHADLRGNAIVANGSEALLQPVNGIFILNGDAIRITDNRISGNGGRAPAVSPDVRGETLQPGIRAGIAVMLAGTGERDTLADIEDQLSSPHPQPIDDDGSAIRVAGNSVRHPEGRALHLVGTGPIAVVGNFFSSEGNHGPDTLQDALMVGDVVFVQNLGAPWETEAIDEVIFSDFFTPSRARPFLGSPPLPFFVATGGSVLFAHNQVTFDWRVMRVPFFEDIPIALFPVTLLTLDHLQIGNNQFAFRLRNDHDSPFTPREGTAAIPGLEEPVVSHVFGVGSTVTTTGNRFSEAVRNTILSLLAMSELLNAATFNQSTHEIMAINNSADVPPAGGLGTAADVETRYRWLQGNQVLFSASTLGPSQLTSLKNFGAAFLGLLFNRPF